MIRPLLTATTALALVGSALPVAASAPDAGQTRFRDLYREIIETNTTLSAGSCTTLAGKIAARLRAAGYPDSDLHLIVPDGLPRQGNLVAILPGTDSAAKAVLLLAHLDVVEAKKEDWKRDPFTLNEENGTFYARGAIDDKSMVATMTDSMIRYKQEGYRPRRTIKLVLTCGEETYTTFDGAQYLAAHDPALIDAGIAINEGGMGILDDKGKPIVLQMEAGEKGYMDYRLEVTDPGGHSSMPTRENAIYRLSQALLKIGAYRFPYHLVDATKAYFAHLAVIKGGALGRDLAGAAATPPDTAALDRLDAMPEYTGLIHTTCVATMSEAGHAPNALPDHATANINCRIMPGETVEQTQAALARAIGDPKVAVTLAATKDPAPIAPPVTEAVLEPARAVARSMWPGVPVVPTIVAGASDCMYINGIGIPCYGLNGLFAPEGSNGMHGVDEHIAVKSLYEARDFMYAVVKRYAQQ